MHPCLFHDVKWTHHGERMLHMTGDRSVELTLKCSHTMLHWGGDAMLSRPTVYVFMCTIQTAENVCLCMLIPYAPLLCRPIRREYTCSRPWHLTAEWGMWTEGFNCLSWLPELFCKVRIYSLPCESNSGVDQRWLPTQITHIVGSSCLQLESLSRRVIVLQRMQCNWALIMHRLASHLCWPCHLWCRYSAYTLCQF